MVRMMTQCLTVLTVVVDLVLALRDQRMPDGTTQNVGQVILDWVSDGHSLINLHLLFSFILNCFH